MAVKTDPSTNSWPENRINRKHLHDKNKALRTTQLCVVVAPEAVLVQFRKSWGHAATSHGPKSSWQLIRILAIRYTATFNWKSRKLKKTHSPIYVHCIPVAYVCDEWCVRILCNCIGDIYASHIRWFKLNYSLRTFYHGCDELLISFLVPSLILFLFLFLPLSISLSLFRSLLVELVAPVNCIVATYFAHVWFKFTLFHNYSAITGDLAKITITIATFACFLTISYMRRQVRTADSNRRNAINSLSSKLVYHASVATPHHSSFHTHFIHQQSNETESRMCVCAI